MSRNITIQEGGVGKQLTVDKLKTNLVGGGTCLWVPEDDVALGSKRISENGTYKASDDGFYGYSQVTVKNAKIASGKIARGATLPTGDGNEYAVTRDNNGDLDFVKIPSSIQVTTLPTTVEYTDGETIDFTGMVVTMYDANDQSMGTVPIGELTLPDTVADGTALVKMSESMTSDLDISPFPQPLEIASSGHSHHEEIINGKHYHMDWVITPTPGMKVAFVAIKVSENDNMLRPFFASDTPGTIALMHFTKHYFDANGNRVDVSDEKTYVNTSSDGITRNGKVAYYRDLTSLTVGDASWEHDFPVYVLPGNNGHKTDAAWTMIHGTRTVAGYSVRVQWPRTGDDKVLETSFAIQIIEAEGGEQGEITRAEVELAITAAQLMGLDVVYIRGVEYTMADAVALHNSLS